ncbi:hypothetical protein [Nonomuraea jiangxiensis]|uniref:Uncharacterized protein n=1 Tax=Nonomuraea jiangxiensis TaxID=633440 RepID=A0A1G9D5Q1_9ACTN|nr:hypothetical protein [Nonomuraea jiangxiensis]SDK59187.1 hypothetical protein SAMN05421869_11720 [Nonomuraea jiangxiensis]
MAIEYVFMLVMGLLMAAVVAVSPIVMALRGIRAGQWPVLRRRLVVWRGFVVR